MTFLHEGKLVKRSGEFVLRKEGSPDLLIKDIFKPLEGCEVHCLIFPVLGTSKVSYDSLSHLATVNVDVSNLLFEAKGKLVLGEHLQVGVSSCCLDDFEGQEIKVTLVPLKKSDAEDRLSFLRDSLKGMSKEFEGFLEAGDE